jgi:hypothetical protein
MSPAENARPCVTPLNGAALLLGGLALPGSAAAGQADVLTAPTPVVRTDDRRHLV